MPKKRTPEELFHAIATIRCLAAEKFELFPLGIMSKMPRDKGFLLHDYAGTDWVDWLKKGGNIGVRARRTDLFIDIDPRNGGDASFDELCWDVDDDFERFPIVTTGSGGRHIYTRIPEGQRLRHLLKAYPGIDFQGFGRYVVAPGSLHPDTGRPYTMAGPLMAFAGESKLLAPEGLMTLLRKPPLPAYTGVGSEVMDCAKLATLLAALDPADFGQGGEHHDQWLDIAMACHHATDGDGLPQWLDWCAGDDRYGDDARIMNTARWESFESSGPGVVTYKTLLRAVVQAGRPELVAGLNREDDARDDFEDDVDEGGDPLDDTVAPDDIDSEYD